MREVNILGINIHAISFDEVKRVIRDVFHKQSLFIVSTPNPEIILHALKDETYHHILNKSDLSLPDGIGLKFAAFVLGQRIPERIAGIDFMLFLCQYGAQSKKSIYLLGSTQEVLLKTKARLEKQYAGIRIVGMHQAGYVSVEGVSENDDRIIHDIQQKKPDIVFVAFGAPKQEKWIYRHKQALSRVNVCVGVGGAFDMIAGKVKRAPRWMRINALEWLFRCLQQPWRIKRIVNAIIVFPCATIWWKFRMNFVYRKNVAGMIINKNQEVLIVQRKGWQDHWQLPQGGIGIFESVIDGAKREMQEEVGLTNIAAIRVKKNFYQYEVDEWHKLQRGYKGQRQTLVIFSFEGDNTDVRVDEFEISDYKWVAKEKLVHHVHPVRREMTKKALLIYQNN